MCLILSRTMVVSSPSVLFALRVSCNEGGNQLKKSYTEIASILRVRYATQTDIHTEQNVQKVNLKRKLSYRTAFPFQNSVTGLFQNV